MPKPRRIALDWKRLLAFEQVEDERRTVQDEGILRLEERLGPKIGAGKGDIRRD